MQLALIALLISLIGCSHLKRECKAAYPDDVTAIHECIELGTYVREIPGPGGASMFEATCSGANRSSGDCLRLAGMRCRNGDYQIISAEKEAGSTTAVVSSWGSSPYSGWGTATVEQNTRRNLFFACKNGSASPRARAPIVKETPRDPEGEMEPAPNFFDGSAMRQRVKSK